MNASRASLRSHATSPQAMREFVQRGVNVFSSATLHAKVLATSRYAIVGSANASANSTTQHEAVVVTDDASTVAAVREFINSIDDATTVSDEFLNEADRFWDEGKPSWPFGKAIEREKGTFLPTPIDRVFLRHWEAVELSSAEEETYRSERKRVHPGPAARFATSWYRTRRDDPLRTGDVVFQVADDGVLWPPEVVTSGPISIPRSRVHCGYILSLRQDLKTVTVEEATHALRQLGIRDPRLRAERRITATAMQDALLGLWGLTR